MDYKYIHQLLDRYWNGQTSLEEEQILHSFFSQLCLPEEFEKYRSLFIYEQSQPLTERLDDDFDERIMSIVEESHTAKSNKVRISERFAPLFRAAAMVAIVLTLGQAAQFSFQHSEAGGMPSQSSYAPKTIQGGQVALNDSARTDSMRQANVELMPTSLPQQGALLLK